MIKKLIFLFLTLYFISFDLKAEVMDTITNWQVYKNEKLILSDNASYFYLRGGSKLLKLKLNLDDVLGISYSECLRLSSYDWTLIIKESSYKETYRLEGFNKENKVMEMKIKDFYKKLIKGKIYKLYLYIKTKYQEKPITEIFSFKLI
jgi:hypothetical protein